MTEGTDADGLSGIPAIPGVEDLEPIGRGGFGVVYRGRQPELAREVAVKVVMSAAHGTAVERWRKEIAAMGRLSNHPNIVTVYSGGVTADGRPYLVMPYVPGGSLHDRLTAQGPLGPAETAALGSKLAAALAAAHAVGVLHRDVKPDNVLVSPYDEPQLTDFGIARLLDSTTTVGGTVHATIRYAAPEVLSGQPATERSDVYGLGATLYACLTGGAPFAEAGEESIVALVGRIASESPRDLRPRGVPDELASAIERALAKSPAERTASADELRSELDEAAAQMEAGAGLAAAPPPTVPAPPLHHERTAAVPVLETVAASYEATQPAPAPARRSSRREPHSSRRWYGVLASVAVLVLGLGALLFVVTKDGDGGPPAGEAAGSEPSVSGNEPEPAQVESSTDPEPNGGAAQQIERRAVEYLDAVRAGDYASSYSMLSPDFRRVQSRAGYERFWRGARPVQVVGDFVVDEGRLVVTVPLILGGKREDYPLSFAKAEDGTWYIDGPRGG